MTDTWILVSGLAVALVVGAAFGTLFFALLWHSTKKMMRAATGAETGVVHLLMGFVLRLAIVAGALVLAIWAGADAAQLLAATVGFTVARQGWVRYTPGQG